MILLTGFYQDPNASRRAELLECLRRNIENEHLSEIHVFIEEPREIEELHQISPNKVRIISHGRRVTFDVLFNFARENLAGRNVVVANADIFFDHSLALVNDIDLTEKLLCLSRWDIQSDGSSHFFEHPGSQDAWIFRAPIPSFNCDFYLGKLGCDNRLAWEAANAGLKVSNPGRSIKAHHLHLSHVRRYTEQERLTGPTRSIVATHLGTRYPSRLGPPPVAELAEVAFYETMGYSVAKLEPGASSHNNESRFLTTIPGSLAGLQFTQVVACAVSPIEIEFRSSGKLYVLVGNDWDGSQAAVTWLNDRGYREDLPLLETEEGCGFEVWSLVAGAGDRFVIPTQVMLVAQRLLNDPPPTQNSVDSNRDPLSALTSLPTATEAENTIRNDRRLQ